MFDLATTTLVALVVCGTLGSALGWGGGHAKICGESLLLQDTPLQQFLNST